MLWKVAQESCLIDMSGFMAFFLPIIPHSFRTVLVGCVRYGLWCADHQHLVLAVNWAVLEKRRVVKVSPHFDGPRTVKVQRAKFSSKFYGTSILYWMSTGMVCGCQSTGKNMIIHSNGGDVYAFTYSCSDLLDILGFVILHISHGPPLIWTFSTIVKSNNTEFMRYLL